MSEFDSNSGLSISYTSYKDLPPPQLNGLTLINQIQNTNWQVQFQAIDGLRSLQKFGWEELQDLLPQIMPHVCELINSLRSNLSKNALMFVCEGYIDGRVGACAMELIPVLLQKAISDKQLIKQEASDCLFNIATALGADEGLVLALVCECNSRSAQIAEKAFGILAIILPKLSVNDLVRVCLQLFDTKRNSIKTHIVGCLKQHKTDPEFERQLHELDQETQVLVQTAVADKVARGGFRSFLAQRKAQQTASSTSDSDVIEVVK